MSYAIASTARAEEKAAIVVATAADAAAAGAAVTAAQASDAMVLVVDQAAFGNEQALHEYADRLRDKLEFGAPWPTTT
jgi:hypothetical protein